MATTAKIARNDHRRRTVAHYGRPRGYIGKAGVSRVRFPEMAHRGELPGITKSSW